MTTVRILNRLFSLMPRTQKMATLNIARMPRPNNSRDARNCRGRCCRTHALRAEPAHFMSSHRMVSFGDVIVRR